MCGPCAVLYKPKKPRPVSCHGHPRYPSIVHRDARVGRRPEQSRPGNCRHQRNPVSIDDDTVAVVVPVLVALTLLASQQRHERRCLVETTKAWTLRTAVTRLARARCPAKTFYACPTAIQHALQCICTRARPGQTAARRLVEKPISQIRSRCTHLAPGGASTARAPPTPPPTDGVNGHQWRPRLGPWPRMTEVGGEGGVWGEATAASTAAALAGCRLIVGISVGLGVADVRACIGLWVFSQLSDGRVPCVGPAAMGIGRLGNAGMRSKGTAVGNR